MVLVSSARVFREIIIWRRNNNFHFSLKGKNGVQNAICAPGVKYGPYYMVEDFVNI